MSTSLFLNSLPAYLLQFKPILFAICISFASLNSYGQYDYDLDGIDSFHDADRDNDGISDKLESATGFLAQNTSGAWYGVTSSTLTVDYQTAFAQTNTGSYTACPQLNYHINTMGADPRMAKYGDATYTFTFSPGVMADEIAYRIDDIDALTTSTSTTTTVTFSVNGGAPNGVLQLVPYTWYTNMSYDATTGVATVNAADNQKIFLQGVDSTLITSLTITTNGIAPPNVDLVSYCLFARAPNDLDGDGLPNHLDLDSDGDLCPDAMEGSGTYLFNSMVTSSMDGGNTGVSYTGDPGAVTDNLGTSSDSEGTPTSGTQGIGASQSYSTTNICSITLPVELCAIELIEIQPCTFELNWLVCSERESDYYELEVSRSGHQWETIEYINAIGDLQEEHLYTSDYINLSESGTHYVRLSEVDQNNVKSILAVKSLECLADEIQLLQYENKIVIDKTNRVEHVNVMNSIGQSVYNISCIEKGAPIELELVHGTYFIHLTLDNGTTQFLKCLI